MARVTYGPEITELAGSIGGVTYQKNASGNIAKLRSNPTVNPTSRQAVHQNNMATLVAFWPTISQADKDEWNTLAAAHLHTTPWGEEKAISGYQWFISVNLNRALYPLGILSNPAAWAAHAPPQAFTLTASALTLKIIWSPDYNPDGHLAVYLSLPLRQSSLKLRRSLFFVDITWAVTPLPEIDITVLFEALANITWAAFYSSANCSIICRLLWGDYNSGYMSSFTSAIVKIG